MRYKKTPQDKRGTYKYFDEKGKVLVEFIPGKDGVTEIDILNLHRIDDHEVYINSKEIKLPEECKAMFEKEKSEFIKNFTAEYGREPYKNEIPKANRQYVYINSQITPTGNELGDSSYLEMQLATYDEKDESDAVIRLNEVVMEMPKQWQKVYRLFFIEEFNKTQISKMLGVSDVRVGQLVNKIKEKIKNDEILKKICD